MLSTKTSAWQEARISKVRVGIFLVSVSRSKSALSPPTPENSWKKKKTWMGDWKRKFYHEWQNCKYHVIRCQCSRLVETTYINLQKIYYMIIIAKKWRANWSFYIHQLTVSKSFYTHLTSSYWQCQSQGPEVKNQQTHKLENCNLFTQIYMY